MSRITTLATRSGRASARASKDGALAFLDRFCFLDCPPSLSFPPFLFESPHLFYCNIPSKFYFPCCHHGRDRSAGKSKRSSFCCFPLGNAWAMWRIISFLFLQFLIFFEKLVIFYLGNTMLNRSRSTVTRTRCNPNKLVSFHFFSLLHHPDILSFSFFFYFSRSDPLRARRAASRRFRAHWRAPRGPRPRQPPQPQQPSGPFFFFSPFFDSYFLT